MRAARPASSASRTTTSTRAIPRAEHALADALAAMGIAGQIGADQDGYPWILGYQGPSLSELTSGEVVRVVAFVEEQMAVKSEAELALIRESSKWGNLAHRLLQQYTRVGLTETEVTQRASDEATTAMLQTLGPLYRGQNPVVRGRARRLSRPDRPRLGDPACAREQRRLPGGRRARDRGERGRVGLSLGAGADDGDRRAERRAAPAVRSHGGAPGHRLRGHQARRALLRCRQGGAGVLRRARADALLAPPHGARHRPALPRGPVSRHGRPHGDRPRHGLHRRAGPLLASSSAASATPTPRSSPKTESSS